MTAWNELREALQSKLDDPVVAASEVDIEPVGRHTVAAAIEMFVTADIVVHTWDLAKAAGLDTTIDREMAERLVGGMQAMEDVLVASGQYKPAVTVPGDAGIEDQLADPTLYERDPRAATQLGKERAQLATNLAGQEERWVELSTRYEEEMAA